MFGERTYRNDPSFISFHTTECSTLVATLSQCNGFNFILISPLSSEYSGIEASVLLYSYVLPLGGTGGLANEDTPLDLGGGGGGIPVLVLIGLSKDDGFKKFPLGSGGGGG